QLRRFFKNSGEHRSSQLSSLRVLVGRMVRGQQNASIGHFVARTMRKDVRALALQLAEALQVIQISIKADLAQGDDDLHPLQSLQFAFKIGRTIRQLSRKRFVGWRGAACGSGYVE